MSKLDDLINKLCPDGVEYKTLGELGEFYGGLTGKGKNDFVDGNAKFITYMNVYKNLKLKLDVPEKVKINPGEKQRTLEYGDVLFTGSSETPDECGISSVLADKTDEKLYLNSFCICFRFNDPTIFNPEFSKYLFRSQELRVQIGKTASGVTRFNVSKEKMKKVIVPIVPLEIQNEIVHILDKFTELEEELEEELEARRKQYEYYRNSLLTFDETTVIKKISDITKKITSGGTPKTTVSSYYGGNIPWLRTQEVNFCEITKTGVSITEEGIKNSSAKWIPENCVIIAMYGATVGKIGINKIPLTTNQACCNLEIDETKAHYKYVYYVLCNRYEYIKSLGQGVQSNINAQIVKDLEIPLPSISVQKEISNLLDKFNAICNDLTSGLPAEIEARHKQYEYYRDKLLTFKRKSA